MRHARRELQDAKRLALAIQSRGKYMADFVTFATAIGEWERARAYLGEVLEAVRAELAESPEVARRFGLRLMEVNKKFEARSTKR
jgi:hypothetical protein